MGNQHGKTVIMGNVSQGDAATLFYTLHYICKAHAHLDALADKAYGLSPSCTDADRVAHLFKLYAEKVNKA